MLETFYINSIAPFWTQFGLGLYALQALQATGRGKSMQLPIMPAAIR
jgi:hypothetical protein